MNAKYITRGATLLVKAEDQRRVIDQQRQANDRRYQPGSSGSGFFAINK